MISMRAVTVCRETERGEEEERASAVPGLFGAGPEVKERELELRSGWGWGGGRGGVRGGGEFLCAPFRAEVLTEEP